MKRKQLVWALALVCMLFFGLQGPACAAEKQIRFGYLVADQLHSPAVMIMKEKKMLEAEGIKVSWGEFLAGSYLMQHMASGEVDFGSGGAVPVMITRGQGVDVVILASANAEGSSIVVKDAIKAPKDLNGKNIGTPGIGSIQDAMVEKVAKDNQVKITRKAMKVSDMPVFLNKGEIDGFMAWAPHTARAVDLKYGHEILTSHDILPGHQCCVLVTKGEMLNKDPETVRKVLKTYLKAYAWFLENKEEAIAMMAKNTGMSAEVIKLALKTVDYPNPPFVNTDSLKVMAQGLVDTGKIQQGTIKNMDDFIAATYRPAMLKELIDKK